ncbi:MAG: metallophosphoesterase [Steroidobacteraceae bacterium]
MTLRLLSFVLLLTVAGCASQPREIRFLAFGDSGYHYDYHLMDDDPEPATYEEFVEYERLEWLEDKRPPAEFRPQHGYRMPESGIWIAASGQMAVANAMRRYCTDASACEFAVMLGDNIYPDGATAGADGRDDATRFRKIFTDPYAPLATLAPDFRIYVTLGNHDWRTSREGAMAQLRFHETTRPFYMDGIRYQVAPTGDARDLEVFVIDTHVLLSGVDVLEDELADDGSELHTEEVDPPSPWSLPQSDEERGMVAWLEQRLAQSPARWKIVIGHHPIWSSAGSKFQQARALRGLILPALCRHADLYLAGHEHTLEVHTDACKDVPEARGKPPLAQVVSGAAGKQRPLNTAFARHQIAANPELSSLWAEGLVWGFAHVTLAADRATIRMVTTPDDQSGTARTAFEHSFERRSERPK